MSLKRIASHTKGMVDEAAHSFLFPGVRIVGKYLGKGDGLLAQSADEPCGKGADVVQKSFDFLAKGATEAAARLAFRDRTSAL